MKRFLPLGSVVKIRGVDHQVLIYGRAQQDLTTNEYYDYIGCEYPLGMRDLHSGILFNNNAISEVFFVGFQDIEELEYRKAFTEYLEKNL